MVLTENWTRIENDIYQNSKLEGKKYMSVDFKASRF
jgi:hypothetical protein